MKKLINFPKLIKTLWICLWAILGILLILKFCFGKWYPIVVENERFLNLCNIIDHTTWAKCLIGCLFYMLSINVWILTATSKRMYTNVVLPIILNIFVLGIFLIKFFVNTTIANFIELIYLVIIPIIHNVRGKTFKKNVINIMLPIIIYVLFNLFQMNILLVRNVKTILSDDMFVIGMIMQIDYYVFLIISYIGVCHMGWWSGGWFFGKSLTELKAEREKELAKEEPDKDFIAELDKAIAEKEAKGE